MEGTYESVLKLICNDDNVFSKIKDAVPKLARTARTKRSELEDTCPSPSECGKLKSGLKHVRAHRPGSGLHVSLQVEAFGKFLDKMKSPDDEIESKFKEAASLLMKAMGKYYDNEIACQTAFSEALQTLFPPFRSVSKSRARSDYTTSVVIDEKNIVLVNWKFKNEMVNISSEPHHQQHGYYIHLKAGMNGCSPMLLTTIVGCHYLQVFGAVWNGNHVCVDPLSGPVSLLPVPKDPRHGHEEVARVLASLSCTVDELHKYYSSYDQESKGPYYRSCSLGSLQNIKKMKTDWLFSAECNGVMVAVKFVRISYGKVVHELLAGKNLAPKLYSVSPLPGGWLAVVMEKVKGVPISTSTDPAIEESLMTAVQLMHSKGYVHGDLRPQNILVVDNRVCILDFDWAGEYPNARYSNQLNMDCNWAPAVKCGGIIEKEHDMYQFKSLFSFST